MKVGQNLQPPCDNAQCACSRAAEFDGLADQCVKSECPAGDLESEFDLTDPPQNDVDNQAANNGNVEMYCAACKECSPSYRCERCPN